MKSKAPQLHLEYRFYKLLGSHGKDKCIFYLLRHWLHKYTSYTGYINF